METARPTPHDSQVRTILEVIGVTVFSFVIALVAGIAFIVPIVALGYDIQTTFVLVGSTAVGQVAMFAVGYAYLRYRNLSVSIAMPTRSALGYVVGGIIVALLVANGLSIALAILDLLPSSVIGDIAATDPTYLLGLAVLSVVVVAPVEEFLFRGVIQRRLSSRFGPTPGIVGASLLFGSMHLTNYSGDVLSVVAGALMIAAVSSVFGIVYEKTNNLAVPVLVHAIYNVILLVVSYVGTVYA